jgi:hypothetical protein
MNGSEKKQDARRNLGTSLLLSPTEKTYRTPSAVTNKSISIFSPPSTTKPRSGWDRASNVDQNRAKQMPLSVPRDLKEVTVSAVSRPTLAALGTTPEKVQASLDVKNNDAVARTPPRQPKGIPSSSSSSASFQLKKPSAAAFPPMSTKAPTPFSQKSERTPSTTLSKSGDSSSYPPLSAIAPKPFSTKSSAGAAVAKKVEPSKSESKPVVAASSSEKITPNKDVSSGFGDMKGLGNSLLSLGGSTDLKAKNASPFAPAKPGSSTTMEGSATPDFKAILTSFYQKHNPTKLSEVDKHLERYKVSGRG